MHYGFALNGKVEDKPLTNGHSDNGLSNGHSNGNTPQIKEEKPEVVTMQQLAIDGKSAAVLDTSTSLYDLCPECEEAAGL